jgi:hypothetical protein
VKLRSYKRIVHPAVEVKADLAGLYLSYFADLFYLLISRKQNPWLIPPASRSETAGTHAKCL